MISLLVVDLFVDKSNGIRKFENEFFFFSIISWRFFRNIGSLGACKKYMLKMYLVDLKRIS
jgi:hypothetical protein